jgi:DtxR family Mn-dependent transcriptional regulator
MWPGPCRNSDEVVITDGGSHDDTPALIRAWGAGQRFPVQVLSEPGANISRAMQLSAPTVHEMIGRLERDGYITRAADKSIAFTPTGQDNAETIVSRHRLIERFLTDVLGIPWHEVHEEAERLEHAMSPVLEERMRAAIGSAKTCPHGHPIQAGARVEGVPLADVEIGAEVQVLRFENEAEDLLQDVAEYGLAEIIQ